MPSRDQKDYDKAHTYGTAAELSTCGLHERRYWLREIVINVANLKG